MIPGAVSRRFGWVARTVCPVCGRAIYGRFATSAEAERLRRERMREAAVRAATAPDGETMAATLARECAPALQRMQTRLLARELAAARAAEADERGLAA